MLFRARINFQKCNRLSLLSHLELVRAMERIIRRAQLPYAVTQGFNAHMRCAPGPALPVGTAGLDEYFDVWITEYIPPEVVVRRLDAASVVGLNILGVKYVATSLRGLQATHVHEEYEVVLVSEQPAVDGGDVARVETQLRALLATGELKVVRKHKAKVYDLGLVMEAEPVVSALQPPEMPLSDTANLLSVKLSLKSSEQGAIKPEVLLREALGERTPFSIKSITRTKLYSDED